MRERGNREGERGEQERGKREREKERERESERVRGRAYVCAPWSNTASLPQLLTEDPQCQLKPVQSG